jgi:hypothetical protein
VAARYVASQLEATGLRPAGADGTWYQPVPLRKVVANSIVVIRGNRQEPLRNSVDAVVFENSEVTDSTVEAPVVFVGFGVTAPERQYDDYSGLDVHGKIVAWLDNAPARFPSTQRAYYADANLKAANAIAQGAIGELVLLLPEDWKRFPCPAASQPARAVARARSALPWSPNTTIRSFRHSVESLIVAKRRLPTVDGARLSDVRRVSRWVRGFGLTQLSIIRGQSTDFGRPTIPPEREHSDFRRHARFPPSIDVTLDGAPAMSLMIETRRSIVIHRSAPIRSATLRP